MVHKSGMDRLLPITWRARQIGSFTSESFVRARWDIFFDELGLTEQEALERTFGIATLAARSNVLSTILLTARDRQRTAKENLLQIASEFAFGVSQ